MRMVSKLRTEASLPYEFPRFDAFGPDADTGATLSTRHAGTRLVSRSQWIKRYDHHPLMRSTACPRTRRERSSRRSPGRNPVAHPNAIARADETPAERDPAPGTRVALDGRDGAPTCAPCRARAGLARRASRRPPRASGRFIRPLPRAQRSHLSFRAVPLTETPHSSRLVPNRWLSSMAAVTSSAASRLSSRSSSSRASTWYVREPPRVRAARRRAAPREGTSRFRV